VSQGARPEAALGECLAPRLIDNVTNRELLYNEEAYPNKGGKVLHLQSCWSAPFQP